MNGIPPETRNKFNSISNSASEYLGHKEGLIEESIITDADCDGDGVIRFTFQAAVRFILENEDEQVVFSFQKALELKEGMGLSDEELMTFYIITQSEFFSHPFQRGEEFVGIQDLHQTLTHLTRAQLEPDIVGLSDRISSLW